MWGERKIFDKANYLLLLMEKQKMIFFETDRLYLRNVIPDDVATMFDYRNNEACARYQRGQTKTYEGIAELARKRKNDKISTF